MLRELLWNRGETFKELAKVKDVQPIIALKANVTPLHELMRKRSPKEKMFEKQAMLKLKNREKLDPSMSPWATYSVFIKKEDWGPHKISEFRRLEDLTVFRFCSIKTIRDILRWLESKRRL